MMTGVYGLLLALTLGVAALAPNLWAPLTLDDHFQVAWLQRSAANSRAPWDLYRWVSAGEPRSLAELGHIPWWSDLRLRIEVFRPISASARWLDHVLLRDSTLAAHLHSLLWWGCLVYLVWRGLARVIPGRGRAIAVVLVALSPALLTPVRWLADRNALISYVFMAAAWCVWSEREGEPRTHVMVAGLAALAALSGEIAWAFLPTLVALSLIRFRDVRRAVSFGLAVLAGLVTVLLLSRALGYGIHHSGIYLDPFSQPGEFVRQLPLRTALMTTRLPAAALSALLPRAGTHAELLALPALLLAVAAPLAMLPGRRERALLLGASFAALVPVLPAVPSLRLVFGQHLALLVFALVPSAGLVSRTRRALTMAPLALLLVGAALSTPRDSLRLSRVQQNVTPLRSVGVRRDDRVLLISTSMFEVFQHPDVIRRTGSSPREWLVACSARAPVLLTRDGAQTFSLRSTIPLLHPADLYRSHHATMHRGERFQVGSTTITIQAVSEGRPTWIQLHLGGDVDSRPWVILQARGFSLQRVPPLAVGGSALISPG